MILWRNQKTNKQKKNGSNPIFQIGKSKVHIKNTFPEPGKPLRRVPQGSILRPLHSLNDMPQAVDCELLLCANETCLKCQHKDITEIESALNKNFTMLCKWFVDTKVSIYFGENKTKSILFGSKHEIKNSKPLKIQYNDTKTKEYSKVTYLVCIFDEIFSGKCRFML